MGNNKSKIIWFLICPILLVLFLIYFICVAYFYDPLQLFSEKYPDMYVGNTRLAAKRVIDNYDFDGVYLGTSMLLMSDPKELKDGKYINITLNASTIKERSNILKYLFYKNKKINNIIYTYDGVGDSFGWYGRDFSLLYKSNLSFDDKLKFYLQGHIDYKCFLKLSKEDECIGNKHNYHDIQMHFIKKDYELNAGDFKNNNLENKFNQKSIIDVLDKYLLVFVKNNPNTIFHIVIPPYNTLFCKKSGYYPNIYIMNIYNKVLIQQANKYENIKIYFFGNEKFVDNMNNYMFDGHYKQHINSRINKAINEGTNIITIDNMDEEFDKFIKKVENYDIKAYEEALKLDIRE